MIKYVDIYLQKLVEYKLNIFHGQNLTNCACSLLSIETKLLKIITKKINIAGQEELGSAG